MTENVRYKNKSVKPEIRVVCEEQSYEDPVEDFGRPPVQSYTAPVAESADPDVEEFYQELGESDINYVVPAETAESDA